MMEITNETELMRLARENNPYLASEELPQNNDLIATVASITKEVVHNPKTNKDSTQTIIRFKESDMKPMVCNKVNMISLSKATQAEVVGEAVGHRVALYRDPTVKFGGKTTGGIRISPYPVDSEEYKRDSATRDQQYGRQKPVQCESCGKDIRGAGGKTAAEVVQIGKTQYGKALCIDCMKKAAAKKEK